MARLTMNDGDPRQPVRIELSRRELEWLNDYMHMSWMTLVPDLITENEEAFVLWCGQLKDSFETLEKLQAEQDAEGYCNHCGGRVGDQMRAHMMTCPLRGRIGEGTQEENDG